MCVCVYMFLMSFFISILLFKLKKDIVFRLPTLNPGMLVKSEVQLKMLCFFFSHISISHVIFGTHFYRHLDYPCGSAGKESTCNVQDLGLIPGLGRSPGEGNGYPLLDSGLENPMDCVVCGGTKKLDTTKQLSLSLYADI